MDSREKQRNTVIRICIDGKEEENIFGTIHTSYKKEGIHFYDIVGLLTEIDKITDERKFPNKMFNRRYLDKKIARTSHLHNVEDKEPDCVRNISELNQEYGKLVTVNLYVNSRKNTSLQGYMIFADTGRLEKYESELELIEVIESYNNVKDNHIKEQMVLDAI